MAAREGAGLTWGPRRRDLTVGLAVSPSGRSSVRDPVVAWIALANHGREAVRVAESHVLREYDVEMRRDGSPVAATAAGEAALRFAQEGEARRIVVTVGPGSVHRVVPDVPLSDWFHLEEPGGYRARAILKSLLDEPLRLESGWAELDRTA